MYQSIEQYRYAALFTAFMSLDESLPTDMILGTAISAATEGAIIDHIEAVRAVTGKDVLLVGTRQAIQKLQSTVTYDIYSGGMKEERYRNGILGYWNGYECLALPRVNLPGTRDNVFSADDQKKIYIMPIGMSDAPIVRVNEGDVVYYETGMDGLKKDMTVDAELAYKEGIGVIISELFGEIKITA